MSDAQQKIAVTIGIPVARRHIFLCAEQTKPKCCDLERGVAAWEFLKRRLKELGLSDQGGILRSEDQLPEDLRRRSDRRRLSGGCVVWRVRSARARADHPGASDWREGRSGSADHRAPPPVVSGFSRTQAGLKTRLYDVASFHDRQLHFHAHDLAADAIARGGELHRLPFLHEQRVRGLIRPEHRIARRSRAFP